MLETTFTAEVLGYVAVILFGLALVLIFDPVYRARRRTNRAARDAKVLQAARTRRPAGGKGARR